MKPAASRWVRAAWEWLGRRLTKAPEQAEAFALGCAGLVGVFALARSEDFPKADAWAAWQPLQLLHIVAAVAVLVTQVYLFLARRRNGRNRALEDACRQVAAYMDEACPKLPLREIGVHIWVVRGPFFAKHLRRGARFLLLGDRTQSGIRWKKGKGVVGIAWERRGYEIKNLDGLAARASTELAWRQLPDADRLGMTWDEFQATKQYKAIYAAPLFDRRQTSGDPEVRGVVAVDVLRRGRYLDLKRATIGSSTFDSIVGVCEAGLTPE
ncbi:MAG: hypothetical protein QOJ22_1073 [Thermoleophilaceae bacterium]|jgi:HAMP domain-containing protein|nr:hypothetical protein [Thermoleophilaceae bacterium]